MIPIYGLFVCKVSWIALGMLQYAQAFARSAAMSRGDPFLCNLASGAPGRLFESSPVAAVK